MPPSPGGGGLVFPHVPTVEPIGRMHVFPGQQSPLMVHGPDCGTQLVPPSGGEKHRKTPVPSGTHGTSLQQSSAEAQVSPASRHSSPRPLHRGTPSGSSWHTPEFPTPAQQLLRDDDEPQV
jgi:hypothetical protein